MKVMVNGLPGNMSREVAELVNSEKDMTLLDMALTGPETVDLSAGIAEGKKIHLYRPSLQADAVRTAKCDFGEFISVDYTHPNAVNNNANFYCEQGLPFVMGTTGGDRNALEQRVRDSDIVAVIAPNMAKQVVAFQAMVKYAAETFPDVYKGYDLAIEESHQQGKVDTSGTAKAMVEYFNQMGMPFAKEQIAMIRDPMEQTKLGVPTSALGGHGWHTYGLKSGDGDVSFEFTHNVDGRRIYAQGTLDAIRFLDKKVEAGERGKVYSMIDVLKG